MLFALKWDRQCDACVYDIQITLDEDFTEVVVNIQGNKPPAGVTVCYPVAKGALSCEITYYCRVRSVEEETEQVIHSWWSESRSFTVVHREV